MQTIGYPSAEDLAQLGTQLQRNIDRVQLSVIKDLETNLTPVLQQLDATIVDMGKEIDGLKPSSSNVTFPPVHNPTDISALEKRLSAKIFSLNNKIDSKAVQIGQYVFSFLDHCVQFATKGIPNGEFQYALTKVEIDEALLKEISSSTGGIYFRATDNKKLEEIYAEINKLEKSEVEEFKYYNYDEKYRLLIILALVLITLEWIGRNSLFKSFI